MAYKHDMTFESLAECAQWIRGNENMWRPENQSDHEEPRTWNGNITLEQALTLAEFGWPEGRNHMSDVTCEMHPEDLDVEMAESFSMDVAGAYPVVPLACAGDPCHMVDVQAIEVPHKIIRVVVTLANSWSINAQTLMTYGAAVLSYVDALESAGWSCEVIGRFDSRAHRNVMAMSVMLKAAGAPLDIDTLAFALVHPAMLRRLFIAYIERFLDSQPHFKSGHGRPHGDNPGDCQIFIPRVPSNDLADKDKSLTYVGTHIDPSLKPTA